MTSFPCMLKGCQKNRFRVSAFRTLKSIPSSEPSRLVFPPPALDPTSFSFFLVFPTLNKVPNFPASLSFQNRTTFVSRNEFSGEETGSRQAGKMPVDQDAGSAWAWSQAVLQLYIS